MRTLTRTLPPLLLLVALAGCQASQESRLAVANDVFASTLDYLSDAREAGKISDKTQTEVIAPARRTIDALLDLAYATIADGNKLRMHDILAQIERELTPLLRAKFAIQREEP